MNATEKVVLLPGEWDLINKLGKVDSFHLADFNKLLARKMAGGQFTTDEVARMIVFSMDILGKSVYGLLFNKLPEIVNVLVGGQEDVANEVKQKLRELRVEVA